MPTILQLGELDSEIQRGDDIVFPFDFTDITIPSAPVPIVITGSVVYMAIKDSEDAETNVLELKTSVHDTANSTHLTLTSAQSTALIRNKHYYYLVAIKDTLNNITTYFDGTFKASLSLTPPPTA